MICDFPPVHSATPFCVIIIVMHGIMMTSLVMSWRYDHHLHRQSITTSITITIISIILLQTAPARVSYFQILSTLPNEVSVFTAWPMFYNIVQNNPETLLQCVVVVRVCVWGGGGGTNIFVNGSSRPGGGGGGGGGCMCVCPGKGYCERIPV